MKAKLKFIMMALLLVITIMPVFSSPDKSALNAKIKEAMVVLANPVPETSALERAFKRLVEVVDAAAPESGFPAEFGVKIAKARKLFESTSIVNPEGIKLLNDAYADIHAGQPYQFPEELTDLKSIMARIEKLSNSAQKNLEAGQTGAAVKSVLEILILIVTPVEATN